MRLMDYMEIRKSKIDSLLYITDEEKIKLNQRKNLKYKN